LHLQVEGFGKTAWQFWTGYPAGAAMLLFPVQVAQLVCKEFAPETCICPVQEVHVCEGFAP
jgi:hypothetical protein